MLLKITERNFWENESWSIVIDPLKQPAEALNLLIIFIRLANQQFEIDYQEAKNKSTGASFFGTPSPVIVAASRYSMDFYDWHEKAYTKIESPDLLLVNHGGKMIFNPAKEGYKGNVMDLDLIISVTKLKSAMVQMRDKKQNKIYKSLENIFLKTKSKS